MQRDRILIVDDDTSVRAVVRERLRFAEFEVMEAENGRQALELVEQYDPDLIVLDIMMPGLDGLAVLQEVRKAHLTPVIMLTARGDITDRIAAIELGADDYMVKPFSPRELESRIRSILRPEDAEAQGAKVTGLELDSRARQARLGDDDAVSLTEMEYHLLALLARHPGRAFTRSEILHRVWGYRMSHFTDGRVVDVHVARLRAKLEADPTLPELILDAMGSGFMCPA